jgi:hypothetical protein
MDDAAKKKKGAVSYLQPSEWSIGECSRNYRNAKIISSSYVVTCPSTEDWHSPVLEHPHEKAREIR